MDTEKLSGLILSAMFLSVRAVGGLVCLVLAVVSAAPVAAADTGPLAQAVVDYSRDPGTLLVSFREVWPEFRDQDPTPLVRVFGDGRVVAYFAAYMNRAGQYEMRLPPDELEALLLQLTPVLLAFDEEQVKRDRQAAEELLRAAALAAEEPTLFYVADAEYSSFHLNIEGYRPGGELGLTISKPELDRTWRGLRFDAERYPELGAIQDLWQVEQTLRALTERDGLVRVESVP